MAVIYACCCGLDIHQKTVVACLMSSAEGQPPLKEGRTFRTMTGGAVAEWIAARLRHGLWRGSFMPATPQRPLRERTRHRMTLVQDRARVMNRVQGV